MSRSTRAAFCMAVALVAALTAAPAAAQGNRSSRALPGFSPETFDLQLALHEHFTAALPAGWWIGPPQRWGKEVVVRVNIPDSWNGNPTAAVMTSCPADNSPIWQVADRITITPHYRNLPWAPHSCLP
ncbi:hypothetical protein [Oceanibaculum indicum]|nr:hypothetical protein [Oceanibaculum indicum]